MTREELTKAMAERIIPQMEELGVLGFVMGGYVEDADGHVTRFATIQINKNPIVEDAMAKWAQALAFWAAPPADFGAPPKTQPAPDRPGGSA